MDQKWLMLVVDGSKSMGPHWPNIFSNFVEKIVRYYHRKWKEEPNAKHTKVEFGLIMYNVQHDDTEWPVEVSYWTSKEEDFLGKLSSLSFNGTDRTFNPFTVHALAEALVMFPKPPIGKGTMEEYYEGERHCIFVPATQPSDITVNVHLPVIQGYHPFGSHTVSSFSHCFHVSEFYVKLGVTLSVITPTLCSGWRAIFRQANNYSKDEDEDNGVSEIGSLIVLIAPKFKEAVEALTDLDPFFSDEGINYLLSSLMDDDEAAANNSTHHDAIITNTTPVQPPQLPDLQNPQGCSSLSLSLNSGANDDNNGASLNAQGFTNETPNSLLLPHAVNYNWMSTEQGILNNSSSNNNVVNSTDHHIMRITANYPSHFSAIKPSLFQSRSSFTEMGSTPPPAEEYSRANNNDNSENVATPGEHSTDNHDAINKDGDNSNSNNNGGGAMSSSSSRRRGKRVTGRKPEGRRGRRQSVASDMDIILHNDPSLHSQLLSFPLGHSPFHITCWEGGIAVGNPGNFKVIASAKAYRKRTAPRTITEGWPLWLLITDFMTKNASSTIRSSQTLIADVDIEMLRTNKDQLFKFLTTRDLCARVSLPSQTLILSPTSEPSRFVGTLLQGGSQ